MAERKKKVLLTAALKTALVNCFDELKIAYPNFFFPVLHEKLAHIFSVSVSTVKRILTAHENAQELSDSKTTSRRKSEIFTNFYFKEELARKMYSFHKENTHFTLDDLLHFAKEELNNYSYGRTTLYKIIRNMGFRYKKCVHTTRRMKETGLRHEFMGLFPQLIAVVTGTINAISDGMQYGWSAPLIPVLHREDSPVKITETDAVWLENIYMIGGMAGLPVVIYCVDKIGRQKTMILACVMNLIAWIIIAVANSVEYLFFARFLTGLAADVNFVAAPMYTAEIANQKIRGLLSGIIFIMLLIGIITIYSIGPFVPVYASSTVAVIILLVELFTFPFMPESPYYLLGKGKYETAKKALSRLRGTSDVDKELQEIAQAVERQRSEKGRPQDLLLVKSNRKAVLIMTVLNGSQHFSSISVVLMNLHVILEAAGSIYVSSNIVAIIFSAAMLVAAILGTFLVDKYGRKILLTSSSLLTGASLFVIAIYFQLKNSEVNVDNVSWLPVVAIVIYAAVFRFGLGMVPIVMTAELFPAKVKAMGMTLSDFMYLAFGLISVELYHVLGEKYGLQAPFFLFSASSLLTAAFCAFVIPETKGKTLEEIQFILKGEKYQRPVGDNKNSEGT